MPRGGRRHCQVRFGRCFHGWLRPTTDRAEEGKPARRKRLQSGLLFRETFRPAGVLLREHLVEETLILIAARKITATAKQQRLVDRRFQMPVQTLAVVVLVWTTRVRPRRLDAVVLHQAINPGREIPVGRQVLHRRAETVRAMTPGRTAQRPDRVLKTFGQTLETLREADTRRLPVRVGQHEMVEQMRERLAADRDVEVRHVGEVRRPHVARIVDLREERLTIRTVRGTPLANLPLERAKLPILKSPRLLRLQLLENRLGLQTRLLAKHRFDFGPHLLEWILSSPPRSRFLHLARHPTTSEVLPRRRQRHPRHLGRLLERHSPAQRVPQTTNILVRFRPRHPCLPGSCQTRKDAISANQMKHVVVVLEKR